MFRIAAWEHRRGSGLIGKAVLREGEEEGESLGGRVGGTQSLCFVLFDKGPVD